MDDAQHQKEAERRSLRRASARSETPFVDDADMIRRLGVAEKIARSAI